MRIGELARRTGTTRRALRYYEEQGLLAPERLPSGYRDYDEACVATVHRIRILLAAGLGTAVVAELLPCGTDDSVVLSAQCSCPELHDLLTRERHRIDTSIAELTAARAMLDSVLGHPLEATGAPPRPDPRRRTQARAATSSVKAATRTATRT